MPKPIKGGEVRRSQLITTYGVGSIIAVADESFVIAGIDRWDVAKCPELHEPRLEQELGVRSFYAPPASDDGDIPAVRFPEWVSCPGCLRLATHRFFTSYDRNTCATCDQSLVPSRFVIACNRGHLDDFPYLDWVHRERLMAAGATHSMTIRAAGASASLSDIEITCECGTSSTMEGAFGRYAMRKVSACHGRRPWLSAGSESCGELPRVLQRGASNVWFPIVRSAISIPPWSEGAFLVLNRWWTVLRHLDELALRSAIEGMGLSTSSGYATAELVDAVQERRNREQGLDSGPTMREAENEALLRGRPETSSAQQFVSIRAEVPEQWREYLDDVRVIPRLREVRALEAFSRILPPSPSDLPDKRVALSASQVGWLPAIEVLGEGVFLTLSATHLSQWETRPSVKSRAERINENYGDRFRRNNLKPDRVISPRFLLVHTLAHLLISQWSLDSGYPAASLRERLYISDSMAGFMIYTATSDSAGSLGGLVAQAQPDRLARSIRDALDRASWCSADPLCMESSAQGVDALNLAACHACVLLPEVSCEELNVLLDRGLTVGTQHPADLGFFSTGRD